MSKQKHLCPCGSGKRAKVCCGAGARAAFSSDEKRRLRDEVERLAADGKHQDAAVLLERLAEASPHNPMIWNDLGVQYEAAGRFDDAVRALRRGHRADATYPPILYNLGKFTLDQLLRLSQRGELEEELEREMSASVIRLLNANLDQDPENADAHDYLAMVYAFKKDEVRAKAHMKVATRMRGEPDASDRWPVPKVGV